MKQHKQDRRSQRTRQLVGAAMMALMLEKRYETITVQDILDRANIGRSTFYTHYFDKEDVLASMIEQMIDGFSQHIAHEDSEDAIVPGLALFRHAQEQYPLYQALARGHGGEVLWQTGQTLLSRRFEQVLTNALSRNIEQALTSALPGKRSPSVPLAVVSQYLAGAFLNLLKWWLEAEMPYSPERMYEIFQQLALPGVWAIVGEPQHR